jgi:putative redox protein
MYPSISDNGPHAVAARRAVPGAIGLQPAFTGCERARVPDTGAMVTITGEYQGDLHCTARHEPSGNTLGTDAPRDNQGRGEAFSPTDLVATAFATCAATTMAIAARKHGVELDGFRYRVTKEMSADAPRRIARLVLDVWLPASAGQISRDPRGGGEWLSRLPQPRAGRREANHVSRRRTLSGKAGRMGGRAEGRKGGRAEGQKDGGAEGRGIPAGGAGFATSGRGGRENANLR